MARASWSPIPDGETLVANRFQAGPGWRTWRPHGTSDWEILITDRGTGRFGHAGGTLSAGPMRVVLIRPGAVHDYGPAPGARFWSVAWVHFQVRDAWLDLLEWPEMAPGLMAIDVSSRQDRTRLLALHDDLTALQHRPDRNRRRLADNLLEQLLIRLDGHHPRTGALRDPRIAVVAERLLHGHGDRNDLARAVGLSASRLSHLFQRQMGLSLPAFRERMRMEQAAELLDTTTESIGAVASRCGYDDPFYFSNRFRRAKGLSPRAWRQRPNRHHYTGYEPPASGWSGHRPAAPREKITGR
jgi:AraC family transcriptional regulator, arabinose operon regulatory protein